MKVALNLGLILFCIVVNCGCRGLQSEMQKSRLADAPSGAIIAGQEMQLEADLSRRLSGERFDLIGTIKVSAANGNFPSAISVTTFR